MVKFVNIVDGSVFYAKPGTIQFRVLKSDKNYEVAEEEEKTLGEMSVAELKDLAKKKEIEGYNNMKKEELLEVLKELEGGD